MIDVPQMLLLGSGGRGSGRTTFACDLIRKVSQHFPVIAAKATTIYERGETCPQGEGGCGVCGSLQGPFLITEERSASEDKDTARLLAAGAKRVYWLRVLEEYLEEGARALLDAIDDPAPIICESNSLRTVVDPALFLMLRRQTARSLKASARRVAKYADRTVTFKGASFDPNLDDLNVAEGVWALREEAAAIILAGGNSTRMQQDKSRLLVRGRPLIEHICARLAPHFKQILISSRNMRECEFPDITVVPDRVPGMGPLMGIASALGASRYERNFVLACDMPDFDVRSVKKVMHAVKGCEVAVAVANGGLAEPLFAVYRKSAASAIEGTLRAGEKSVKDVFNRCSVKYVPIFPQQLGRNLNTPQDYADFVSQETLK